MYDKEIQESVPMSVITNFTPKTEEDTEQSHKPGLHYVLPRDEKEAARCATNLDHQSLRFADALKVKSAT